MSWVTAELVIFAACLPGLFMGWSGCDHKNKEHADIAIGILVSSALVMLICAGIYIGRMVL